MSGAGRIDRRAAACIAAAAGVHARKCRLARSADCAADIHLRLAGRDLLRRLFFGLRFRCSFFLGFLCGALSARQAACRVDRAACGAGRVAGDVSGCAAKAAAESSAQTTAKPATELGVSWKDEQSRQGNAGGQTSARHELSSNRGPTPSGKVNAVPWRRFTVGRAAKPESALKRGQPELAADPCCFTQYSGVSDFSLGLLEKVWFPDFP